MEQTEYVRNTGPGDTLRATWNIIDEINSLDKVNLQAMWAVILEAARIARRENLSSFGEDRDAITDAITRAGMQWAYVYTWGYYKAFSAPGVLRDPDTPEDNGGEVTRVL